MPMHALPEAPRGRDELAVSPQKHRTANVMHAANRPNAARGGTARRATRAGGSEPSPSCQVSRTTNDAPIRPRLVPALLPAH